MILSFLPFYKLVPALAQNFSFFLYPFPEADNTLCFIRSHCQMGSKAVKLTAPHFFSPFFTSIKGFFSMTVPAISFFYKNISQVTHRRTLCAFNIVSPQTALRKSCRLIIYVLYKKRLPILKCIADDTECFFRIVSPAFGGGNNTQPNWDKTEDRLSLSVSSNSFSNSSTVWLSHIRTAISAKKRLHHKSLF